MMTRYLASCCQGGQDRKSKCVRLRFPDHKKKMPLRFFSRGLQSSIANTTPPTIPTLTEDRHRLNGHLLTV